ncbi:MAG: hypothetical protein LDL15_00585 [Yonghaparkia sp.]|nr:hypothetical protein [Microcella sp.]
MAVIALALVVLVGLAGLQFLVVYAPHFGPYLGAVLFLLALVGMIAGISLLNRNRAFGDLRRLRAIHGAEACLARFAETPASTWHWGVVVASAGAIAVHVRGETRAVQVNDADLRARRTVSGAQREYVHVRRPHGVFAIEPLRDDGSQVSQSERIAFASRIQAGNDRP